MRLNDYDQHKLDEQEPKRRPFIPSAELCDMLSARAQLDFEYDDHGGDESCPDDWRVHYIETSAEMDKAIQAQQTAEGFRQQTPCPRCGRMWTAGDAQCGICDDKDFKAWEDEVE